MKYLLVPFLCVFLYQATQTATKDPEKEAIVKECTASSNADPALVEKLSSKGELTDDPNMKCFLKCLAIKQGAMTESGQVIPDLVKEKFVTAGIPADKSSEVIDACVALTAPDACETAYVITKCVLDRVKGN